MFRFRFAKHLRFPFRFTLMKICPFQFQFQLTNITLSELKTPQRNAHMQGGPKTGTLFDALTSYALISSNIDRFSNLFHGPASGLALKQHTRTVIG